MNATPWGFPRRRMSLLMGLTCATSIAASKAGQGLEVRTVASRHRRGEHPRVLEATWQPGLRTALLHRLVLLPGAHRRADRLQPMEEVLVPRIGRRGGSALGQTRFPGAAVLPLRLLLADDELRQGKVVADGVTGRQPGLAPPPWTGSSLPDSKSSRATVA